MCYLKQSEQNTARERELTFDEGCILVEMSERKSGKIERKKEMIELRLKF